LIQLAMAFTSVTRLRLRSLRFLPVFLLYAIRSDRQLRRAKGYRAGWLGREGVFGFWTATVWESPEAMRQFRNSPPHLIAMGKLIDWCDEASFASWEQADAAIPDADTAYRHLRDGGRVSKVRYPSTRHRDGRTVGDTRPNPGSPRRSA
jgi:hypothetical protein